MATLATNAVMLQGIQAVGLGVMAAGATEGIAEFGSDDMLRHLSSVVANAKVMDNTLCNRNATQMMAAVVKAPITKSALVRALRRGGFAESVAESRSSAPVSDVVTLANYSRCDISDRVLRPSSQQDRTFGRV